MKILFIGAHPDDIELGASGLVIAALEKSHEVEWAVLSRADDQPGNEEILSEFKQSSSILGVKNTNVFSFPALHLPEYSSEIRQTLEKIRDSFNPDLIATHSMNDNMQDHHTAYQEAERLFRNYTLISYDCFKSN